MFKLNFKLPWKSTPTPTRTTALTSTTALTQDTPKISDAQKITTVIAKTAEFHGDLHLAEGVKIEGRVCGNVIIDGDGLLFVGDTGVIEGDVKARCAIITGRIAGRVNIARLVLQPSAVIDGTLTYASLKMYDGATVTGTMSRADALGVGAPTNVTPLVSASAVMSAIAGS